MDVKKVGEFIRQKRKEKNLIQKELAQKLSITDRAISKWERGICCPDISLLKDLSSILGVSVNELLSGEDIEKLEIEQSEDILVETVKQYTSVEKKKKRKLLIFTVIMLVFYAGLVFAMYLTYNQVTKNDKMNWYTYSNKKVMDRFLTALENYDYETLKNMEKNSYSAGMSGTTLGGVIIEDETKCKEYKEKRKTGEFVSGPGTICKLKYFEEIGVKFISHEYLYQTYIDGSGEWATSYDLVIEYDGTKIYFGIGGFVRNGVIADMFGGAKAEQDDPYYWIKYPDVDNKLYNFFSGDPVWEE